MFTIAALLYFSCEALTEAATWKADQFIRIDPAAYHLYRTGELFGIIGMVLLAPMIAPYSTLLLCMLGAGNLGIYIYERILAKQLHNNWFFVPPWPYKIGSLEVAYPPLIAQSFVALCALSLLIAIAIV